MEFASELVVRALQCQLRIAEVPTKLFRDGRNRRPHLRPWHDGFRHVTYLVKARFRRSAGQKCAPTSPTRAVADCTSLAKGFTLIEVLVAIVIIGLLIALLLPAIQSVRESGRLTQCSNNLKQLTVAALSHEQAHGFFPTGGWGYRNVGHPDKGFGETQPGGWVYTTLPYCGELALFNLGSGMTEDALHKATSVRLRTPVALHACPSRRAAGPFAVRGEDCLSPFGSAPILEAARTDYAANTGDHVLESEFDSDWPLAFEGPATFAEARELTKRKAWPDLSQLATGISYVRSRVKAAQVLDGLANTYLLGEKYVMADAYENGEDWADNESMYCGYNNDIYRSTNPYWSPANDEPGIRRLGSFGSAHRLVFQMSLCDGSVRAASYGIDAEVHRALGNRKDSGPR